MTRRTSLSNSGDMPAAGRPLLSKSSALARLVGVQADSRFHPRAQHLARPQPRLPLLLVQIAHGVALIYEMPARLYPGRAAYLGQGVIPIVGICFGQEALDQGGKRTRWAAKSTPRPKSARALSSRSF
jgi:hypothetical protein